jgi:uncharacterized repeat protein (TIGR03803 family)
MPHRCPPPVSGSARSTSMNKICVNKLQTLKIASISLLFFLGVMVSGLSAQTYTTLYSFTDPNFGPPSSSLQGADGSFYGTLPGLDAPLDNCVPSGNNCGTIFTITAGGVLTTLGFFAPTGASYPNPGLVEDAEGNFWGTTEFGGAGTACLQDTPCGTVFELTAGGSLTLIFTFTSPGGPAYPVAGLVAGSDGNFYGTTSAVASTQSSGQCCGTVFQITPSGTLTTLYTFPQVTDGVYPAAPLVQGTDGNFYGTTTATNTGTVFQITPAGVLATLYTFCSSGPPCADGANPNALIQGTDGNFYGTTQADGANNGGTVFQLTPTGLTTLYSFCALANCADGANPRAGLVQASDGNFYGTTFSGGTASDSSAACASSGGCGTIFEITSTGTLTTLYNFCSQPNCADGSQPTAGLLQAADRVFYGTTTSNGAYQAGTFFSLSNGLSGTTLSATNLILQPASVTIGSSGPVVMTATVAPASGSGTTPTGTVAFSNGSTYLGTAALVAGLGTYNYDPSGLAVGTYQISAAYSGDATYAVSTSSAQTLTVNAQPPAATPTFSLAAGTYSSAQGLTISDATAGAIVYYTTDGSPPTTSSTVYFGPIVVNSTETIKAIAVAGGYSNSNVASATYTINLAADYQFSASPTSLSIQAGQSASTTLTVTPENGFDFQVSFSCGGLASGTTCSFKPASVTPSGNTAATTTLTIGTTAASAALRPPGRSTLRWAYGLLLPCMGMILCGAGRSRRWSRSLWVVGLAGVLLLAAGLSSCSSANKSGTSSTQATIMVTASTGGSAAITHTVSLTVTITQ